MSLQHQPRLTIAIAASIAAAVFYALLLRSLIALLHPKMGMLLDIAQAIGGTRGVDWTTEHVCLPAYEFLVAVAWPHLWASVTAVAVAAGLLGAAIQSRSSREQT